MRLNILRHFARTRWQLRFSTREQLEQWQEKRLQHFLTHILPQAARYRDLSYRGLADLPLMDKNIMMENFAACNTRGISAEEASQVALQAETTRDFAPLLGDLTVGLSSGTSGNRGIFLASPAERDYWAGVLLARTLPTDSLFHLLSLWKRPLRIAFFLRANSTLYTTLQSRRIDFQFYDLLQGVENLLPRLNHAPPDVLVAPPAMLRAIAKAQREGKITIAPQHIFSVADVLESEDKSAIFAAFSRPVRQIYQATEGFLAYPCEQGNLHLNEAFIHFQPQWLDADKTRFQPVITDFTRSTQLIVRYRLNDILRLNPAGCPCGRVEKTLAAIEGRSDEVLWLPAQQTGQAVAIFPDMVRRALLYVGNEIAEYSVRQEGKTFHLALQTHNPTAAAEGIRQQLAMLWARLDVAPPELIFHSWQPPAAGAKRRRMVLVHPPDGLEPSF